MRYLVIETDLEALSKIADARVDTEAFHALFQARLKDAKVKIPRGIETFFERDAKTWGIIKKFHETSLKLDQSELKKQRERLKGAAEKLKTKETKTAKLEQQRAAAKVKKLEYRMRRYQESGLKPYDHRLYPFFYGPLLVMEKGQRLIVPSRFHCRPNGQKPDFDRKAYSMYKARLESLTPEYFERIATHSGKESLWRPLFGRNHGALFIKAFYENVAGEVKGFATNEGSAEIVPCLFDRWKSGAKTLHSFALITAEAPEVIVRAGYDRAPAGLRIGKLNEWLLPEGRSDEELLALLRHKEDGIRFEVAA